ncbi:hypothetical protein MHH60_25860 [Paenibacillus sp. FSL H7-0716]|uniref:Type II secretion system protein GspF domain-containing protein n=1 Tax=Paenibacillus odorifer TaxID=189426 RepID=A0AB36JBP7_9BACL|nr:hypothetical protein [Paenibacillus odorifer]OME19789.1 hypothetical protein BSK47_14540 [Paenibacillus odorifer]
MMREWLSPLLGIATVLFLAAVAAFLWLSRRDSEVAAVRRYEALRKPGQAPRKQAIYSLMQQLYRVCEQIPVLRAYLQHLRRRLVILRLGDEWKLRLETMKSALLMWLVLFVAAIPLVLAVRDPFTLAMLGMGLWVGHGILLDMGVHRLEMRLLRQLRLFLGDVRHHYHRHGMVEEAIYDAADGAPYEMALHGQELYDMLTDSDAEDKLAQYVEHAPNRYLQGFAGLSYLIKEHGDQQTENGSVYLKGLEKLSVELNLELLRRERLSFLLQGLIVIALLPLLFTRPIESWASHFFPAMDTFYASAFGWATKLGLLVVVWLCYVLLRNLSELDATVRPTSRKRWEQRVYGWPWMRGLLHRMGPIPDSREAQRITRLLKDTASPLRLEWFYVQRIVAGVAAFLTVLGLFVSLHVAERHQLLYAPVKPGTLFGQLSPEEETTARETAALDRRILDQLEEVRPRNENSVIGLLRKDSILQVKEDQLREAARRILNKLEQLNQPLLAWWEVFLAFAAGWGGYVLPVGVRLFQRRMRQMEMKHEVDQLQAVIAMLAALDRMSVEQLLVWMEQFAFIFREPLQACLLHVEQGEEQALAQLKEDAPFLPFVRLVEKLEMSSQHLTIRQAFDDLEAEQAFAREQRKQEYEQLIEQKAGWGRWIGFAPLMTLIFGYLVIPLVVVSLHQMTTYYDQLHRIQ